MRIGQLMCVVVWALLAGTHAWPRPHNTGFTADFVNTTNGKTTATGRLSVQDLSVRQEKKTGERLSVMILNRSAKKLWFLDPPFKTYWELPLTEASYRLRLQALQGATPTSPGVDLKRLGFKTKKFGRETVRGFLCQKSQTTCRESEPRSGSPPSSTGPSKPKPSLLPTRRAPPTAPSIATSNKARCRPHASRFPPDTRRSRRR